MVSEYCPGICAELERSWNENGGCELESDFRDDVANRSYSRPPAERNPCGCIVELPYLAPPGVATLSPKRPYFGTRHPYIHHAPNDPEHEDESEDEEDEEDDEEESDDDESEEDEEEHKEEHKKEYAGERKQSVLARIRKFFLG